MKDNDQLIFTSFSLGINTFGLMFFWIGVFFFYFAAKDFRTIANVLGALVIILMGLLILLLRRIHLINRRKLTVGTYLGFIIPFKGTLRILLKFNMRSIKSFDRVTVRHEDTYVAPEPGHISGSITENYVGLANDQTEIRLATFDSLASAKKHAEDIEKFLYSD